MTSGDFICKDSLTEEENSISYIEKCDEELRDHTIIVICGSAVCAEQILSSLFEADVRAVGPASTARLALTLAAVTSPTLALIAEPPTGARGSTALAQALAETWGIPSLILHRRGSPAEEALEQDWAPSPHQISSLYRAIDGRKALEGAAV